MLAIFGSSSPQFTPPLSDKAQVLKLDLPMQPLFQTRLPAGTFQLHDANDPAKKCTATSPSITVK